MQQQAAQAYQQTAKQTVSPRELEANILTRSAGNLVRIQDNWETSQDALYEALTFNRRLWTVFIDTVSKDENPLPKEIKQNIANLGVFILKHTMEVQLEPKPGQLDVLININREVANGLRASMDNE
jgi:flagellar protein FlaF